jgi:hypothetical protein
MYWGKEKLRGKGYSEPGDKKEKRDNLNSLG